MDGVTFQRRRKENVAQEHGNANAYRAPVVKTLRVESIKEVHYHHHDACDVEQVQNQFGPCLAKPEFSDSVEHSAYRENYTYRCKCDIKDLRFIFESCFEHVRKSL